MVLGQVATVVNLHELSIGTSLSLELRGSATSTNFYELCFTNSCAALLNSKTVSPSVSCHVISECHITQLNSVASINIPPYLSVLLPHEPSFGSMLLYRYTHVDNTVIMSCTFFHERTLGTDSPRNDELI